MNNGLIIFDTEKLCSTRIEAFKRVSGTHMFNSQENSKGPFLTSLIRYEINFFEAFCHTRIGSLAMEEGFLHNHSDISKSL